MVKRILHITFFFLLVQVNFAQVVFQRIYGNGNSTYPRDVIQTKDSGYAIVGSSSGYGDQTANVFLMKTDSLGNFLWTQYYGESNADWGNKMIEHPNGDITICGYTNSSGNGGYDILLIHTDSLGNELWSKTYGGSEWDFGRSLVRDTAENIYITGSTYSFGAGNEDGFLLKCNSNGDSLAMVFYGGPDNESFHDITIDQDGFLYLTGEFTQALTGKDIWLVKTNDNLGTVYNITKGNTFNEIGRSVSISRFDKQIILGGDTDSTFGINQGSGFYVIKLDSMTNPVCDYGYGLEGEDHCYDIAERPNGDLMIAGNLDRNSVNLGNDMMVYYGVPACFYFGGQFYGDGGNEDARSVKTTFDGGHIIVGESQTGPGIANILLVKIDPGFSIPTSTVTYFDVTPVPEFSTISLQVYPNPFQQEFTIDLNKEGKTEIAVYDLSGKLLISSIEVDGKIRVDASSLSEGIYLLTVENEEGRTTRLLIKGGQ